jgi:aminopeptidase N
MEVDESIALLAAKLDDWFDGNITTFASQDRKAQGKSIFRGIAIAKELDQLKAEGSAAISALLARQSAMPRNQNPASLIQAFSSAAKLRAALHDELLDTDGANKLTSLMNEIATALDATDDGRAALAVLLDDYDERVRASAGSYLLILNLMPERVVPILREIDESNEGASADFTAHWALLDWELKQKAKAGKPD